eukprot:gene11882-10373_t
MFTGEWAGAGAGAGAEAEIDISTAGTGAGAGAGAGTGTNIDSTAADHTNDGVVGVIAGIGLWKIQILIEVL